MVDGLSILSGSFAAITRCFRGCLQLRRFEFDSRVGTTVRNFRAAPCSAGMDHRQHPESPALDETEDTAVVAQGLAGRRRVTGLHGTTLCDLLALCASGAPGSAWVPVRRTRQFRNPCPI